MGATAWRIFKLIGTQSREGDAVVLVGDFNAEAHSETVRELDRRIHKVYTGTSFGGVDHVFSSCGGGQVLARRNLGGGGSDHDALSSSSSSSSSSASSSSSSSSSS